MTIPVNNEVFKNVMYERFYSFSDMKKLFQSNRFGFRSMRSTIYTHAEITEVSRQGSTDRLNCKWFDLTKTFDTNNHQFF